VVSLGLTVAACVVAGLMVGWISRRIHRELGGEPHEVRSVANDVAAGDLTEHFTVPASDQDSVMASMARMRNNLSGIVRSVRESADQLVRASSEIAQGNHDLSQRTEEQASALEQTAASMEQIGSTVQSNATHAQEAHALAQSATEVAERSEQAVRDVVQTMQGIDQGSRRIADITSVIDGIAFQTNILALNAAVEAARAGEQGRGFAVVAGEVRTLAQRSAEAAREIRQLIGGSVDQVAQGVALVQSSGETIHQAVTSIHQLGQLIADIAHASREQNDGVGQVVTAVSQLDQTTQQNAALVEQSSAAASSLHDQAESLVRSVAYFRTTAA
jgi:methyl-accepting chemotaxis protein